MTTCIREFKGNSLLELCEDYVVVDIETTGFSSQYDNIIEIGAIKVKNDKIIDELQSLIKIDKKLSVMISNLTGITDEMLCRGENINIVLKKFKKFIENEVIVAHNANFDINFLYDKCLLHINEYLKNDFIDTLRIAKKLLRNLPNYKLPTLAEYFQIHNSNAHRALADAKATYEVYKQLKYYDKNYQEIKIAEIRNNLKLCDDFNNKKVVVKTSLQNLSYEIIKQILSEQNAKIYDIFYSSSDYLIINDRIYEKYISMDIMEISNQHWLYKAKTLENKGTLKVISESYFCNLYHIEFPKRATVQQKSFSAKDIVPQTENFDETHPFYHKTCVFTGALERMTRTQAMQMVVNIGGFCANTVTMKTNYLILGNNDYCKSITDGKSTKQKKAENLKLKGYDIEIIPEDVFYEMIEED